MLTSLFIDQYKAHWVSSWTSNTVESLDVNKVVIGLRKMGHFFEIWTWTGCRQAKSSFGHMLFNITKKSNQIFVVLLLTTKNNCSRTINRGINVIKSSFDGFFFSHKSSQEGQLWEEPSISKMLCLEYTMQLTLYDLWDKLLNGSHAMFKSL